MLQSNGATATIEVENPATGRRITTVPLLGPDERRAMAGRAREAQPAWEAAGFDGRGRILRRAQKWMVDNAERVIETVMSESGKTYDFHRYDDAGHAFFAVDRPSYRVAAANDGWERVTDFFAANLGG